MSVLIRDMKIPKGCAFCPILSHQFCYAAKIFMEKPSMTSRHERCPLIELPPHGRLIDADKLAEHKSTEWICGRKWANVSWKAVCNAPTVIEAEMRK